MVVVGASVVVVVEASVIVVVGASVVVVVWAPVVVVISDKAKSTYESGLIYMFSGFKGDGH